MAKLRGRGIAAVNYPTGMNLGGDPTHDGGVRAEHRRDSRRREHDVSAVGGLRPHVWDIRTDCSTDIADEGPGGCGPDQELPARVVSQRERHGSAGKQERHLHGRSTE